MRKGKRKRATNDDDRHKPPLRLPSWYQAMWLFAMFDLPVGTKVERREAACFRKDLLKEGFSMMQFSVNARYCVSEEVSDAICKHVEGMLPAEGQVRLVSVTERQFAKQRVYIKGKRGGAEDKPVQLMMF